MIVSFLLKLSIRILWWLFLNFWWFEQSRFNVFIFLSLLSACQLSLSTKKIRGAALGTAAGCRGIFCLYFSDATLLAALLQKRMKYVNVILFRIACYTIKIQNCPPKDIFKKFERKAHNHSTLANLKRSEFRRAQIASSLDFTLASLGGQPGGLVRGMNCISI